VQGQALIALASGESEFYGLVRGAIESMFCAHLLEFFEHEVIQILESDSSAARGAAGRMGVGKRMKHLETNTLFVQDLVAKNKLKLEKVPKDKNVADLGTKYVDKATMERLVRLLAAFWLQIGAKVADAAKVNKIQEEDAETKAVAIQEIYEKAEQFVMTADLKDWLIMSVIVSVLVQLALKIFENVVLNKIMAGGARLWRSCCGRRRHDRDIELEIISTKTENTVIHLYECDSVKRMARTNRKSWRICTACERYLAKEQNRIVEVRSEEV